MFNYPSAALEEALVNAAYHRSYSLREPIEVQVLPDQILVLSYPGPDRSVALADLQKERIVSRRYRNRRIGDFFKELDLTEGRYTGIPKMREAMAHNGSPPPRLITDEDRTFFRLELLIHPAFTQARVEAGVKARVKARVEDRVAVFTDTELRILRALLRGPTAVKDIVAALGHKTASGGLRKALDRLDALCLIKLTIPDRPHSRRQQRRLTDEGKRIIQSIGEDEG